MQEKSIARLGNVMFYLGGAVWGAYVLARYALGLDVTVRQFLPYHLAAIIPGVLLRHGAGQIVRFMARG
jgi:hypothetical protein